MKQLMTLKKLPLKNDPIITSECWTYYKMAIIETHPNAKAWLASHMKLMSTTFPFTKSFYGENMHIHNMHYYGEILIIEEINPLYLMDNSSFSRKLVAEIDNGNYIVIYCNTPTLDDINSDEIFAHEILLYGYDTKRKIFYVLPSPTYGYDTERKVYYPLPSPNKEPDGGIEVSFSTLEIAYRQMMDNWNVDPTSLYSKREIEFTVARMHLRKDYSGCNAVYDAIERIENEMDSTESVRKSYDEFGNLLTEKTSVMGLANISLLQEIVRDIIINPVKNDIRGIPLSQNIMPMFRKFCEMRKLIYISIKFVISALNIEDLSALAVADEYSKCINNMEKMLYMSAKFRITGDTNILLRIEEELDSQRVKELYCLSIFHKIASKAFFDKEIAMHNNLKDNIIFQKALCNL